MTRFEPRISSVGSDRSTNWATTLARDYAVTCTNQACYCLPTYLPSCLWTNNHLPRLASTSLNKLSLIEMPWDGLLVDVNCSVTRWNNLGRGCGKRARLLFQRSEFEYHWSQQIFAVMLCLKRKQKNKKRPGLANFFLKKVAQSYQNVEQKVTTAAVI